MSCINCREDTILHGNGLCYDCVKLKKSEGIESIIITRKEKNSEVIQKINKIKEWIVKESLESNKKDNFKELLIKKLDQLSYMSEGIERNRLQIRKLKSLADKIKE